MNNPENQQTMKVSNNYVEEKLLVVEYSDTKNQEIVKYDNGTLFLFECKNKNKENKNLMTAEFTPGKGLNLSFSDFENDSIIDCPNYKDINEQFSKLMKHIYLLILCK